MERKASPRATHAGTLFGSCKRVGRGFAINRGVSERVLQVQELIADCLNLKRVVFNKFGQFAPYHAACRAEGMSTTERNRSMLPTTITKKDDSAGCRLVHPRGKLGTHKAGHRLTPAVTAHSSKRARPGRQRAASGSRGSRSNGRKNN